MYGSDPEMLRFAWTNRSPLDHSVKKYLWPTKKLVNAQDADEVVADLTKSIYDGIKVAQKFEEAGGRYEMDYDEFHHIYSKMIMEYVSTMRSTCQTECKKAVMGKLT